MDQFEPELDPQASEHPAEQPVEIGIEIRPAMSGSRPKYSAKGPLYDVYYQGRHLLRSWNPEFEAARALRKLGIRGTMYVHRPGKPPHMRTNIDWAAKMTISESAKEGPVLRPYREAGSSKPWETG